jgi:mono/diheme cytochrome c family protein
MIFTLTKWSVIIILALIGILAVAVAFMHDRKWEAPYPKIKASTDSAVIARGKYLVMGPAHCADCHAAPGTENAVDKGEEVPLQGGRFFVIPPAKVYPPNITPDMTGIGKMKDEEIARSLRHGVGYDGRNFLDFMPFHNTSDEDLTAIISYLRASQPVKNEVPPTEYTILGKVLMSFAIEPVGPTGDVARSVKRDSTAEYGKYMAFSVANCYGCHTERDLKTGDFIGQPFAGGLELDMGGEYLFYSPNITNDKKTGRLHGWTEEQFISRFREGKKIPGSPMPWGPFSRMDEVDLKAIYRYMQTVEPVEREHKNLIVKKS